MWVFCFFYCLFASLKFIRNREGWWLKIVRDPEFGCRVSKYNFHDACGVGRRVLRLHFLWCVWLIVMLWCDGVCKMSVVWNFEFEKWVLFVVSFVLLLCVCFLSLWVWCVFFGCRWGMFCFVVFRCVVVWFPWRWPGFCQLLEFDDVIAVGGIGASWRWRVVTSVVVHSDLVVR